MQDLHSQVLGLRIAFKKGPIPKRDLLKLLSSELRKRTIELGAASCLLLEFCDAVVELDEEMKITVTSNQLSTLLLPLGVHKRRVEKGNCYDDVWTNIMESDA